MYYSVSLLETVGSKTGIIPLYNFLVMSVLTWDEDRESLSWSTRDELNPEIGWSVECGIHIH